MTTGGFRVSPLEVEAAFQGAPGLTDCAAAPSTIKAETHVIALAHVGDARTEDALRALAETAARPLQATPPLCRAARPAPLAQWQARPPRAGQLLKDRT
jgi:acyl-coenzyme A synthetase/AMP-(fatty) acid ligase